MGLEKITYETNVAKKGGGKFFRNRANCPCLRGLR